MLQLDTLELNEMCSTVENLAPVTTVAQWTLQMTLMFITPV